MSESLMLEIPVIAIISWVAYRLNFVEKKVLSIERRQENIENILNIPVQSLVKQIENGELTLTEKAREESNTLNEDSPMSSTKKAEGQSL